MSTPTCPFCGAGSKGDWGQSQTPWYKCGTMIHRDRTSRADQTNQCVEDEVGRLTDQRDQLLQKVQRLEAVQSAGIAPQRCEAYLRAMNLWRDQ